MKKTDLWISSKIDAARKYLKLRFHSLDPSHKLFDWNDGTIFSVSLQTKISEIEINKYLLKAVLDQPVICDEDRVSVDGLYSLNYGGLRTGVERETTLQNSVIIFLKKKK